MTPLQLTELRFLYLPLFALSLWLFTGCEQTQEEAVDNSPVVVNKTTDFELTGDGGAPNWDETSWVPIPQRRTTGLTAETRVKTLYSDTGIYFLFYCEDDTLNASMQADFMDLWHEDVVEAFLWTEETFPVYFEYEISPLNYELPILIPNNDGEFLGWRPWHYEGDRRTRHATSVQGGAKETSAAITSWMAEFFIPYELLTPLGNVPPASGTEWRVNMYRVDYDGGESSSWEWQETTGSFHQYEVFGTFRFE
ncbi:MAG TPA: carbohydrate-binding family 9-like protein [bacterium]|nr:carbohydrate-binding family 9-like protein [bacterium]